MKKERLLLIFILLLGIFLTGCEAHYFLEIKDNNFNEQISFKNIKDKDLEKQQTTWEELKERNYPALKDKNYHKEMKGKDLTLTSSYKPSQFSESTLFKNCFKNNVFLDEDKYWYIKGYDDFLCFYDDGQVVFEIKTNYPVLTSNAQKVRGNSYIWKLSSKTYNKSEGLFIQIAKEGKKSYSKKNQISWGQVVIFLVFLLLIGVSLTIIKIKK